MIVPSAARMVVIASDTGSLTPSRRTNVHSRVSVSLLSRAVPEHGRDGDAELGRQALELIGVVEQLGVMAPDDVGGAVAEHALGAAVEDRDQPVRVGADDRVLRRRVEHRAERIPGRDGRGLARSQRLVRPAALGHVACGGLKLADLALLVEHGAPACLHPDPVAVLVPAAAFGARRPVLQHGLQVAGDVLAVVGVDDVDCGAADQLVGLVPEQRATGRRDVGADARADRCS